MGTGWLVAHVCGLNRRKNSLNSYKPARRKKKWNANTEGFFFPQKRWDRDKLKLGADLFEVWRYVHENISVVRRNGNQIRIFLTIPKKIKIMWLSVWHVAHYGCVPAGVVCARKDSRYLYYYFTKSERSSRWPQPKQENCSLLLNKTW